MGNKGKAQGGMIFALELVVFMNRSERTDAAEMCFFFPIRLFLVSSLFISPSLVFPC